MEKTLRFLKQEFFRHPTVTGYPSDTREFFSMAPILSIRPISA